MSPKLHDYQKFIRILSVDSPPDEAKLLIILHNITICINVC